MPWDMCSLQQLEGHMFGMIVVLYPRNFEKAARVSGTERSRVRSTGASVILEQDKLHPGGAVSFATTTSVPSTSSIPVRVYGYETPDHGHKPAARKRGLTPHQSCDPWSLPGLSQCSAWCVHHLDVVLPERSPSMSYTASESLAKIGADLAVEPVVRQSSANCSRPASLKGAISISRVTFRHR